MSRLIDHFASWMTGGGIFATLNGMPWDSDGTDKTALDIEYFGNHSGLKESSPIIEKMTSWPDDTQITPVELSRLHAIIKNKFLLSWQKIYAALITDYKPLENYNMTEITTPRVETVRKENTDITVTNNANGNVYGFNSVDPVPASVSGGTSHTVGNENVNKVTESKTGNDTLTRSGNIGVTTSQQMLESEIALRKQHFFDIVFTNVDTILAIPAWRD